MEYNREALKSLNHISNDTLKVGLGDLLIKIIDKLNEIQNSDINTKSNPVKIDYIKNTNATTIKQIVADYNELLNHLRDAGLMNDK